MSSAIVLVVVPIQMAGLNLAKALKTHHPQQEAAPSLQNSTAQMATVGTATPARHLSRRPSHGQPRTLPSTAKKA